jgi:hypothetical protein
MRYDNILVIALSTTNSERERQGAYLPRPPGKIKTRTLDNRRGIATFARRAKSCIRRDDARNGQG